MKRTLDRALSEVSSSVKGLRAAVLSAAPDGLLAWSWSDEDKHEQALGFAALDRAATICLEGLGAARSGRSLLLTAEDTWLASWPLYDTPARPGAREHLVLTTVFAGELQGGMVMVYGSRLRMHLRDALEDALVAEISQTRAQLLRRVLDSDAPDATLRALARSLGVDVGRLARLESLSPMQRQRLLQHP